MLELHHITGRDSNSALNGVVVCHDCHSHFGHSRDEEQELFATNLQILFQKNYVITEHDLDFIRSHEYLVINNPHLDNVLEW